MSIMTDYDIIEECKKSGMIEPFIDRATREVDGKKVVSFGLSAAGYDIRASSEWKKVCYDMILDPLEPHEGQWNAFTCKTPFQLDVDEFILTKSVEYFKMPDDVMAIAVGKSTNARNGIIVNITPLEPGWTGFLVIEIHNAGQVPVIIRPEQGIAQLIFHRLDKRPLVTYKDKGGKYMAQQGVVLSKG